MKSLTMIQDDKSTQSPNQQAFLFDQALIDHGMAPLTSSSITTLQVNLGKLCNQTCHHCHVDAGPHRTEVMNQNTMDMVLRVLEDHPQITTVDITGGAPEMNPHFEYFVAQCKRIGRHVIDRCNLTVFFVKGKAHLPQFLANHQVEVIASLPCFLEKNVDQQRGKGVFDRSIAALQQLNQVGYGWEDNVLRLNLVYNPLGPKLPPSQAELESDYKTQLRERFGIRFNHLFTITNMPISRFLEDLQRTGQEQEYLHLLMTSFNPASVKGLMCRSLISVGWDGQLYDCDFNQMLELPLSEPHPPTIDKFHFPDLVQHRIVTGQHCYGCTAGPGSSCGGALD